MKTKLAITALASALVGAVIVYFYQTMSLTTESTTAPIPANTSKDLYCHIATSGKPIVVDERYEVISSPDPMKDYEPDRNLPRLLIEDWHTTGDYACGKDRYGKPIIVDE